MGSAITFLLYTTFADSIPEWEAFGLAPDEKQQRRDSFLFHQRWPLYLGNPTFKKDSSRHIADRLRRSHGPAPRPLSKAARQLRSFFYPQNNLIPPAGCYAGPASMPAGPPPTTGLFIKTFALLISVSASRPRLGV
jgi:hypothetical protein